MSENEETVNDPPVFTKTFTLGEGFIMLDALCCLAYALEGDADSVAVYMEGGDLCGNIDTVDEMHLSIKEQMQPFITETSAKLREAIQRAKQDTEAIIEELIEEEGEDPDKFFGIDK